MSGTLVLVAGKDPLGDDAGHSSYVRAHARAAVRAGYRPIYLCVGRSAAVIERDFGTVVRVGSPIRPVRGMMLPAHGPLLTRAVIRLARDRPQPVLAHGFGSWTYAAVKGCAALGADGVEATAIASAYATHAAEVSSQLLGVAGEPLAARLSYGAQAIWVRTLISRYERTALAGSAAVYTNYESVRRLIRAQHGGEIVVRDLPYAPETAFSDRAEGADAQPPAVLAALEPAGAPLVVSASSHNGRKGVGVLINAVARARAGGTPLRACLLGAGRLLEADRARIRKLGLERSVIAPGWVADQRPYLRAASIFALPSLAEQSGSMALLEALQYSKPAVVSAVDGITEDITDEVDGLIVPPGNVDGLAGALTRLARDRELRQRLGSSGRRTFERRFSADGLTEALAAAYAEHGLEPGE
jgi:glycosyltransferase involved in cell wall biosynthesis